MLQTTCKCALCKYQALLRLGVRPPLATLVARRPTIGQRIQRFVGRLAKKGPLR